MIKFYSQKDPRWAGNKYYGNFSFSNYGCFVTSLAMLDGREPPEVARIIREAGGFASGGLLISDIAAKALGLEYSGRTTTPQSEVCIAETDHYRNQGYPQHFFVWLGGGMIHDPLLSQGNTVNNYRITSWRLFRPKGGSDMDTVKLVTNIFERVWRRCNDLAPANMDSLRSEAEDVIRRFPKDDWAASGYIDRWFDGYEARKLKEISALRAEVKKLKDQLNVTNVALNRANVGLDDALAELQGAKETVAELKATLATQKKECEDKLKGCEQGQGYGFWEYLGLAIRALFNKRKED